MKKRFALLSLILCVALLLVSCSGGASDEKAKIKVGALKGPSSIGMVSLMDRNNKNESSNAYDFYIAGAADDIVAKVSSGELDVAAVPTNLASTLYNKTSGNVLIACVSTLGSLYLLENGNTINSAEDLRGKEIYNTGRGATPECVLNFILAENGIDPQNDADVQYMAEHTELAAALTSNEVSIGLLPEPFATTVLLANSNVRIALDLNDEWKKACDAKGLSENLLTMGSVIVNKEFADKNKDVFNKMMDEYKASIEFVNENPKDASLLVESFEIMPSAAVAEKAIPGCKMTFIDGEEMRKSVSSYLTILFEQEPKLVGGKLPDEDFYYSR